MNFFFGSNRSARTARVAASLQGLLAFSPSAILKRVTFYALLLAPAFSSSAATVAGVSFTGTTSAHSDTTSRMIGWQFTVGASALEVVSLGFQDFGVDGLLFSHEVGIWRLSDQQLVASAVVSAGTAAPLDSFFRYTSLSSPVTLTSGTEYVIAAFDNGRDPQVWDVAKAGYPNMEVSGFAVDSAITLGDPGTAYGPAMSSFGFPTAGPIQDGRSALLGPNLQYNLVPEPSAALLVAVAALQALCLRRRR